MSQQDDTEKKPGMVKRAAGKVAEHTKVRHEIPRWVMYLVVVLGVIGIVYGTVQLFREWRWKRLLTASKIRITELEKEKEEAVLKTTRDLSTKAITISKEKIEVINKQIKKIEKEKRALQNTVGRMKPSGLKKGFKDEGF